MYYSCPLRTNLLLIFLSIFSLVSYAQTIVSSLSELRAAVQNSNQDIVLESGNYYLEDLPSDSRVINCSGSGNTIDMTGARINTLVGSIREVYFIISGDNNVLINGAIEDFYKSGLSEVTDFSAYNNDRDNLAYGLAGDPIMSITGNQNEVEGLEMIVKGSFPYGYGSQYGIGSKNTFGLSKRCGILITGSDGGGIGNTLDGITMYHFAFGHGIFMQTGASETTIKNCYIEGRLRLSDDMYNDTETYDLPYITDYKFPTGDDYRTLPFIESYDIPYGHVYPLSEDGIRSYNSTGSVIVENCTVKQMRGGIRLYLASSATVTNSTAIDCGSGGTNYNMPAGSTITGSSGNFTYAPLSDFRLSRSRQNIEMTIIPSPNAVGPHNIADILGNDHTIIFHRTPGPLDLDEERAIVVSGNNSTIVNETEYRIILESGTSGNNITSCGPVTDNGSNNITITEECGPIECDTHDAFSVIQAEDFCDQSNVRVTDSNAVGYIQNGSWVKYEGVNFGDGVASITASVSSGSAGGKIEIRQGSETGNLLGTLEVPNTGSWTDWETHSVNIESVSGEQVICLVFTGDSGYLLDVDWFQFSNQTLSNDELILNDVSKIKIYPNPVAETTTILNAANTVISIYDINGSLVLSQAISSESEILDLSLITTTGIYYAEINRGAKKIIDKLIKQ